MDLLDVAILGLRLVLVALVYLFLVFVIRSAVAGLRPSVTTPVRSASSTSLSLVVLEPGNAQLTVGDVLRLSSGTLVGRSERADVVVSDATVSAEHARVQRVGRAWTVTDLGSTNGTRVNDLPVAGSAPLADGDVLGLGGVRFRVRY